MPTIRKAATPPRPEPSPQNKSATGEAPPPNADPPDHTEDEIPLLSTIFSDWQKEDAEKPDSTANRIESTVIGLLSSVETWKREILQSADQREERLKEGMRSIEALIVRTQQADADVERGIRQTLAAIWDKTRELGPAGSAESRKLAEERAGIVRALEVVNARIAGLEKSIEQRQDILAQQFGSLVEALKQTLEEANKSSGQMQARVLRGLEAVDERMALRQQEAQQVVLSQLAVLLQTNLATLETAVAQRTSELAAHQASAHAEILTTLETTARRATESDAAAEAESQAGHTATQTVLEAGLTGVAGALTQLADSVQQLRNDISQAESQTDALRAEVRESAGQTQALREQLQDTSGKTEALRTEIHQVAGQAQGLRDELRQSTARSEARFVDHTESLEQRLVQALGEFRLVSREDQHNSKLELENRIHLGITEPLKGVVGLMHTQLSEIQTTAQKTLDAIRSIDAITRLERSATQSDQRAQKSSNIVELSSHSQTESHPPER